MDTGYVGRPFQREINVGLVITLFQSRDTSVKLKSSLAVSLLKISRRRSSVVMTILVGDWVMRRRWVAREDEAAVAAEAEIMSREV